MFIYGRQPVLEAIRSPHPVKQVMLARGSTGKIIGQIEKVCAAKQIPLKFIEKNQLQKFVGPVVHQGVVAEVEFKPFLSGTQFEALLQNTERPFLLVLDHVQDPHNVGAILRTAEIAGVDCVILPQKGSAPLNATVAKTSAGALFYNQFYMVENLEVVLQQLADLQIVRFAALPSAGQIIYQANFVKPLALVIGSEDKGVRRNLLKFCDQKVKIPQFGHVNSLNASVSTAIILFEIVRQRHFLR